MVTTQWGGMRGPIWLGRGIVYDEAYKFLEEMRLLDTPPRVLSWVLFGSPSHGLPP